MTHYRKRRSKDGSEKESALVVDDEPDVVYIVKTMLEAEGFEVLCANAGRNLLQDL